MLVFLNSSRVARACAVLRPNTPDPTMMTEEGICFVEEAIYTSRKDGNSGKEIFLWFKEEREGTRLCGNVQKRQILLLVYFPGIPGRVNGRAYIRGLGWVERNGSEVECTKSLLVPEVKLADASTTAYLQF